MMKVYCIYDKVAEEGSSLIEAKNDKVALRIFNDTVAKYKLDPDEMRLFYLGDYDPEKPILEGFAVPRFVNVDVEDDNE